MLSLSIIEAFKLAIPSATTRKMTSLGLWEQVLSNLAEGLTAANINDAEDIFRQLLAHMPREQLNRLDMGNYNRTERRFIDEERVNRARARADLAATNQPAPSQTQTSSSDTNASGPPPVHNHDGQASNPSSAQPTTPRASKKKPQSWYMYPQYHPQVAERVADVPFNPSDADDDGYKDKNVIGSFKCSNRGCRNVWTSGIVAAMVRRYNHPQLSYNVKVFNQRCRNCNALGIMKIDTNIYAERVARQIKIWKGEPVPRVPYFKKKTPPHETEHCEGCKAGHCHADE
ncbi:hypothetical protein TWF696_005846 [Orbilia brochopaga]|uniref:3CxxC-type domain-containing protein n=1 Tax=Orbilia brochopaga TaxID=3140254 RepID=A0AAV9UUC0_9PEZI